MPASVPTGEGSKTERARRSVETVPDEDLPGVARQILAAGVARADTRNAIEDLLWVAEPGPQIPARTRRDLARALDLDVFLPAYERFKALLHRLWVLGEDTDFFFTPGDGWSLSAEIDRHVRNNPDWTAEYLFERIGAFDAIDQRFARFLEGLVSGQTLVDEDAQRRVAAVCNEHLHRVGLELRETGEADGYPVFHLTSTRAHTGRPKTLIFATPRKPDLRFHVLDNEVEIATGADRVLIYDRPISQDGLRWRDLQDWWKDRQGLTSDDEVRHTLWQRLWDSLPESPPQRLLFELYRQIHGARGADLPALLPEVWLHWDPKTVQERGVNAMRNLRMDFLMLLPGGHRIVLEVDGKHHYATGDRADPAVYAATMRGDRDLRFARYDVFRFGAAELDSQARALPLLRAFFADLFRTYQVT
ncbi:hypothetical protein [Dactylosporangium sp. NPDC048998]|uniref:AbiJ-related protein n=1 Tax=Dactylosporangium sp. NPDC048998 TaxID=3363976 RepID=UPI003722CAF2